MSEAKFTKGEWFFDEDSIVADGLNICFFYDDWITCDNMHNNAHLIAATPKMYEEIERDVANLRSLLVDMNPSSLEAAATERKIARKTKLLAEARGEKC